MRAFFRELAWLIRRLPLFLLVAAVALLLLAVAVVMLARLT